MTESSIEANGRCYRFLTFKYGTWEECEADNWGTVGAKKRTKLLKSVAHTLTSMSSVVV